MLIKKKTDNFTQFRNRSIEMVSANRQVEICKQMVCFLKDRTVFKNASELIADSGALAHLIQAERLFRQETHKKNRRQEQDNEYQRTR